jgi:hypothetical protein
VSLVIVVVGIGFYCFIAFLLLLLDLRGGKRKEKETRKLGG